MNFQLSEEQLALKNMALAFANDLLAPDSKHWDETGYFPVEVLKQAASLGMAGIVAKEDIGGSGLKRLDAALIFEALSSGCIATSAYLSIHNMVTTAIDNYALPELRAKIGPNLTSMAWLASYCLTEPEAGSDAASLKTSAIKEGDYYRLRGVKAFISGATVSDVYLVFARTGDDTWRGISCFLVEKTTPGLSFGMLEKKMGWKCQPTAMVYLDDCKIPATHLIGQEGDGFKIALNALNGGRINIASCSLGGALACLKITKDYILTRKQFGEALSERQALRFYYADMLTDFEAARLMVYRAATALDNHDNNALMYCAMAKRMATDVAFAISDRAMQLLGGYGYLQDYRIEQIFRDLRVHQILEGTNEIMREIVAKTVLQEDFLIE